MYNSLYALLLLWHAHTGPEEIAPTTGVRYGSKKDVFNVNKNISTERATKFHGKLYSVVVRLSGADENSLRGCTPNPNKGLQPLSH